MKLINLILGVYVERRPLASRGTSAAKNTAKFLAGMNISPNDISIMSVVFSGLSLLFFWLAVSNSLFLFLAALCIQLRLLCNLFDGMVAIEYNKKSVYGNLFNDIPDRFADVIIIVGAGLYSYHREQTFTSAMDLAWLNGALAVLTAYIRVLGTSLGAPTFFGGVMAKPQRMAIITGATIIAMVPFVNFPVIYTALVIMLIGQCLTVYTRIKYIAADLKQKDIK